MKTLRVKAARTPACGDEGVGRTAIQYYDLNFARAVKCDPIPGRRTAKNAVTGCSSAAAKIRSSLRDISRRVRRNEKITTDVQVLPEVCTAFCKRSGKLNAAKVASVVLQCACPSDRAGWIRAAKDREIEEPRPAAKCHVALPDTPLIRVGATKTVGKQNVRRWGRIPGRLG